MKLNWRSFGRWFEIDRGGKPGILFLEGMRGFAMLGVFGIHYVVNFNLYLPEASLSRYITDIINNVCHSSVDLFFLISGYLTYGAFLSRERLYFPYLKRRIQRLYPVFLVVFAIYVVLSFLAPEISKIPTEPGDAVLYLLANLLLLPGFFNIIPMISVTWALSYELFSYILIPPVTMILHSWQPISRVFAAVLIAAALIGASLFIDLPVRMSAFAAGMVVYELNKTQRKWHLPAGAGIVAIVILCAILLQLSEDRTGIAVRAAVNFIALIILILDPFDNPAGHLDRWFSWTPLRWFGNISYSYFLIHGLVLRIGKYILEQAYPPDHASTGLFWTGMAVSFPITIAAALVLYLTIEKHISWRSSMTNEQLERTRTTSSPNH